MILQRTLSPDEIKVHYLVGKPTGGEFKSLKQ